jgi:cell division protein FtsB
LADPADSDFDDWFELYNPTTNVIHLAGYTLTDVPGDPTKFTIPPGITVPARGFLLVWADEEQGLLTPIAVRGVDMPAAVPATDGIPARAIREQQTVVVRDIPADTPFRVRLGYDDAVPRTVAAVPLRFRDSTLGVLVLGLLHDLDADQLAFIDDAARRVGIGLQNVKTYERVQALHAELTERNQQVQAQNEELQAQNEELQAIIQLIRDGFFSRGNSSQFQPLIDDLVYHDPYFVFADYQSYADCQALVDQTYRDREAWSKMSILNAARSGKFSSDRTIREYCRDIWHVDPVHVELISQEEVKAGLVQ